MTAVRGPFVFTSDRFQDEMITKAKSAGCKSLALQLGVAPAGAADKVRAAGLQVIGWGACDINTLVQLDAMKAAVWMPQIESTREFETLISILKAAAEDHPPCEPVATSAGMETEKPNATDAEKVAERNRRRDLLRSFGVTKVWVEVYKQDADRSGQQQLGHVDIMCAFFVNAFGFSRAYPVLGLWTVDDSQPWAKNPYSVSSYDLSNFGRSFGVWRAEQMADARYAEMAAVPDVVVPPPPPPPSSALTPQQIREKVVKLTDPWTKANRNQPLARITIIDRIAEQFYTDVQWKRMAPAIKLLLDQEQDEA